MIDKCAKSSATIAA